MPRRDLVASTGEACAFADDLLFSRLQEHGIEFSGFFTALLAALLVGKAMLVTDKPALYGPLRCPCTAKELVRFFPNVTALKLAKQRPGAVPGLCLLETSVDQ